MRLGGKAFCWALGKPFITSINVACAAPRSSLSYDLESGDLDEVVAKVRCGKHQITGDHLGRCCEMCLMWLRLLFVAVNKAGEGGHRGCVELLLNGW